MVVSPTHLEREVGTRLAVHLAPPNAAVLHLTLSHVRRDA